MCLSATSAAAAALGQQLLQTVSLSLLSSWAAILSSLPFYSPLSISAMPAAAGHSREFTSLQHFLGAAARLLLLSLLYGCLPTFIPPAAFPLAEAPGCFCSWSVLGGRPLACSCNRRPNTWCRPPTVQHRGWNRSGCSTINNNSTAQIPHRPLQRRISVGLQIAAINGEVDWTQLLSHGEVAGKDERRPGINQDSSFWPGVPVRHTNPDTALQWGV